MNVQRKLTKKEGAENDETVSNGLPRCQSTGGEVCITAAGTFDDVHVVGATWWCHGYSCLVTGDTDSGVMVMR